MKLWLIPTLLLLSASAQAACVCRCVGGEVQPICTSSLDLPPICSPRMCPMTSPSLEPLARPTLPPLGTSSCQQRQVLDESTGRYRWRTICQ